MYGAIFGVVNASPDSLADFSIASTAETAKAYAAKLLADPMITVAEVAGPGFLNMRLDAGVWQGVVKSALTDPTYGQSTLGQNAKMLVEYVSANPTGPLHVGHTRGAVFGDALASLLDYAGYDVTKEYYVNDGGAQVDVLARSVYLRYLQAHGQDVDFPEGTYPGDYLIPVGQALKDKVGDAYIGQGEDVWLLEIREFATAAMMDLIRIDLASLGVVMDTFAALAALMRSLWQSAPRAVWNGLTAPFLSESDGSWIALCRSIPMTFPKPRQSSQAPIGELNEWGISQPRY